MSFSNGQPASTQPALGRVVEDPHAVWLKSPCRDVVQFLEAPQGGAGEVPNPPEWQMARPHLTGYDLMQVCQTTAKR